MSNRPRLAAERPGRSGRESTAGVDGAPCAMVSARFSRHLHLQCEALFRQLRKGAGQNSFPSTEPDRFAAPYLGASVLCG